MTAVNPAPAPTTPRRRQKRTPAGPVPYAVKVGFSAKALQFVQAGKLTAAPITTDTWTVWGTCPNCGDPFHDVYETRRTSVSVTGTAAVAGAEGGLELEYVPTICQCEVEHGKDHAGCGARFPTMIDRQATTAPDARTVARAIDDRDALQALAGLDDGTAETRISTSAGRWAAGLVALLALLIPAGWLAGKDVLDSVVSAQRETIIWIGLAALVFQAAAAGLLLAITAGIPRTFDLRDIVAKHGTVRAYREHLRVVSRNLWVGALLAGGLSVLCTVVALTIFLLSQIPPDGPQINIVKDDKVVVCGTLKEGDNELFKIRQDGDRHDTQVRVADISEVTLVERCAAGEHGEPELGEPE